MPTDQELQQMVGDPKYKTDAAYRAKVEKLFNARYNYLSTTITSVSDLTRLVRVFFCLVAFYTKRNTIGAKAYCCCLTTL
jgi:hypothetical protein